jgi:hypothetical protein
MKQVHGPRGPHPLRFPIEQRIRHLAAQVAPGDEDKQSRVRSVGLFDVALRGRDALVGRGVRK